MDFGLDKLIEMIEERFGRVWGTLALLAIMLAAFAIAIHAVFAYLILPVFREGPPLLSQVIPAFKRLTFADAIYALVEVGIGLIGALVFFAVSPLIIRRIHRRTKDAVFDAKQIIEDCEAHSEKNHAKLEKKFQELEAIRASLEAEIAEFRREVDQAHQGEGSGTQSPQGTGSGRQP